MSHARNRDPAHWIVIGVHTSSRFTYTIIITMDAYRLLLLLPLLQLQLRKLHLLQQMLLLRPLQSRPRLLSRLLPTMGM